MLKELSDIIPSSRIRSELFDRVTYASDAGFYYLVPKAVVQPVSEEEIRQLFRFSQQKKLPLVFRAGGTSLSGQSVTDGLLVDLSQHWSKVIIEDDGSRVRVQPGITGAMVNARLRSHGRKIGPDPSSISAAMMGGILSNNASGMCCGVAQNAYHTLRDLRFMLSNGHAYTISSPGDRDAFEREQPALFQLMGDIRLSIMSDDVLRERIRNKYKMKTTVGYSLNAFIDHEHPIDIFAHLLIGGEGTLAFIVEAVLDTIPEYPFRSTSLLYFQNIHAACSAIPLLLESGAAMAELMDRASLRSVQDMSGMPSVVRTLPDEAAALLIEFQEPDRKALTAKVDGFLSQVTTLNLLHAPVFTEDPAAQAFLWKVRKGLFPAVGAVRASGTSVILEDLAFPIEKLADAVTDLQALFFTHGYDNGIIFGHAKDGNIHFVVTQSFNTPDEVERYDRFIRDLVTLVIDRYDGTLKAEHGTGRNMAPFVETEWGPEAYQIMRRIKEAVDPEGILNPGVIINDDASAHLRDLKRMPAVEEEVDRCIECGYCEHRCPSRDLTASPRRRIVARRVLQNMKEDGDMQAYGELLRAFQYDGLDTCAVDGLCATACPVDINTGDLVKRLRRESHEPRANAMALLVAKNFTTAERIARMALHIGAGLNRWLGAGFMTGLTTGIRRLVKSFPVWTKVLSAPPSLSVLQQHQKAVGEGGIVYFPSCISRTMGTYPGENRNIMEVFLSVCRQADIPVTIPDAMTGTCCSQIFSSKGYSDAWKYTANHVVDRLWKASDNGRLDIITDVSSCAHTLQHLEPALDADHRVKYRQMRFLDALDLLHDRILPVLPHTPVKRQVMLHPVCTLERNGGTPKLRRIAERCADQVTIPLNAGCCGMAGDRGFLFPELTASATRNEASEALESACDGHYATTRTCEMALSEATGKDYASILFLVDDALRMHAAQSEKYK
jgi:D-lactate dehydrogenase